MISEKLVNKVLGIHINNIQIHDLHNKENELNINGVQYNIHELAHKCKEWAKTKGFYIQSYIPMVGDVDGGVVFGHSTSSKIVEKHRFADTEPEAIFKACEWILNQKDEK